MTTQASPYASAASKCVATRSSGAVSATRSAAACRCCEARDDGASSAATASCTIGCINERPSPGASSSTRRSWSAAASARSRPTPASAAACPQRRVRTRAPPPPARVARIPGRAWPDERAGCDPAPRSPAPAPCGPARRSGVRPRYGVPRSAPADRTGCRPSPLGRSDTARRPRAVPIPGGPAPRRRAHSTAKAAGSCRRRRTGRAPRQSGQPPPRAGQRQAGTRAETRSVVPDRAGNERRPGRSSARRRG